ncbi:histidine decarboxylase-like [Lineus longissimus]|uniref:histidine decarboxylase-like n=1 Tax=Lineus longissimus TaxID=88925 RepID=UPI002B4E3409
MDAEEYRRRGKEMVDYIADYLENIRTRRVFPDVSPGYMRPLLPESAPTTGEEWDDIFKDVERVIMPGVTHWQSPYMHAYFPALNSYPSLLGDMLADAINCLGFTWASSPACTELETIVMDWLGKMIGLPQEFLHSNEQTMGGGVIQTTASESTFIALMAARTEALRRYKAKNRELSDAFINNRLVAYCSDQAHSSVEKAGLIGMVKMHFLPADEKLSLRGETLKEAITKDKEDGFIPFFLCATLGTTGSCAFDNLRELGPICDAENMWMHIDAAYAGTAFICPEFRSYMEGIEHGHSFAFNPSKWMMVHFDCTAMWVRNSGALHRTFNVDPLYLKHENSGAAIDYMHWQIPLSKRFRALKLWFVIRSFGVQGLQKHIREGVRLAKKFEMLVRADPRFEVSAERVLGMVVFRLKGENLLTEELLKRLNKSGEVHMVPASLKGRYVIRFTVTSNKTTDKDIERDWYIIRQMACVVLGQEEEEELSNTEEGKENLDEEDKIVENGKVEIKPSVPHSMYKHVARVGMLKKEFGLSLILSNVPMSPRFINGSFAAVFDNTEVLYEFAKYLADRDFSRPTMIMSPRRKLKSKGKQYSLDASVLQISAPARKPQLQSKFKQSSLDSKIEEIFENNENNENSNSNSGTSTSQEGSNSAESSSEAGDDVTNSARSQSFESQSRSPLRRQRSIKSPTEDGATEKLNGHRLICTYCGHEVCA